MSIELKNLYNKLKSKEEDLRGLKESYNRTIDLYRGYGDYIGSKDIEEQLNHLGDIAKEMSKIELDIVWIKYVIKNSENKVLCEICL